MSSQFMPAWALSGLWAGSSSRSAQGPTIRLQSNVIYTSLNDEV